MVRSQFRMLRRIVQFFISFCLSLCMCLCLCVCVSVSLCVLTSLSLSVFHPPSQSVSVCVCACVSVSMCVSIYICVCVCVCVYVCVCVSGSLNPSLSLHSFRTCFMAVSSCNISWVFLKTQDGNIYKRIRNTLNEIEKSIITR